MTTASISRDAIRFSILLTLLFAIAAIAVRVTISVVEDIPGLKPETTALVSFAIIAITFGFMCIAGAIGVWTIRYSVAREGRRRIGRFVDELASIHDGIMTLDRQGLIIGSNPALRILTARPVKAGDAFISAFPCLTETDRPLLLNPKETREFERSCSANGPPRTLRFRSQPAEDMHVIFVSDITHHRAEQQRREQIARFQLVGRIARGVAYDFNNILCGIAGHGSLLRRMRSGSEEMLQSAATITRDAERGITLSRHLLDLSHSGMAGLPTDRLEHYSGRSAELLRIALSSAWTVTLAVDSGFDAVTLSGIQLEQVILNLGLLSADALARPGTLRITVNKPGQDHLLQVSPSNAAVLIISASSGAVEPRSAPPSLDKVIPADAESGIILSVVRTMIEECGGKLECFASGHEQALYRVLLPRSTLFTGAEKETELTEFLGGMRLILAGRLEITARIREAMAHAENTVIHEIHDACDLLVQAEADTALDVILIDQRLIGHEPDAFLRALMKLRPQAGIVIIQDEQAVPPLYTRGVITIGSAVLSTDLAGAIIEAKGLAHRLR